MPKRPPIVLPNQRPELTRVHVAPDRHVYTGIGHLPVREGEPVDLPKDHAAELLGDGHVETPEAFAKRRRAAEDQRQADAEADKAAADKQTAAAEVAATQGTSAA